MNPDRPLLLAPLPPKPLLIFISSALIAWLMGSVAESCERLFPPTGPSGHECPPADPSEGWG